MSSQIVPALTYPQVRMLAEATLGVNGTATFTFNPDGSWGPELVPPGAQVTQPQVTVPIANTPDYTAVSAVVVQVGSKGLNAVQFQADALFWSDAAVQKFVLPYVASCHGYEASASLQSVHTAWNGVYQGLRVVALMHVPPGQTPPGQVPSGTPAPVEPLWVVYVLDEGSVSTLPLSQFPPAANPLLQAPPAQPAVPSAAYYPLPDPLPAGSILPGYQTLRAMAEWSASLGAQTQPGTAVPWYFPYDLSTGTLEPPVQAVPPLQGEYLVVPVCNPSVRVHPTVLLQGASPTIIEVGNESGFWTIDLTQPALQADAVFWSTGAIEQFMLPYYASIDGFGGLADLQDIQAAWTGDEVGSGGSNLVPQVGVEAGVEVVALVHLPRSEWVTGEEESAASVETGMAFLDEDATPRVVRAREFTARRVTEV